MKTAEEFIDENYHIAAENPNVIICDKTKKEVTIEEVAQSYSDLTNAKLVEENKQERERSCLFADTTASYIKANDQLQSELSELKKKSERVIKTNKEMGQHINKLVSELSSSKDYIKELEETVLSQNGELVKCKERVKELEESLTDCIHVMELDNEFKDGYPDELNRAINLLTPKQHG
jgi:chromosome segregation ATPase